MRHARRARYNCAVLFRMASDPGTPGWPNEDYACIGPGAAVLLDGATTFPPGADIGCQHGVAWYARTLGTDLLAAITAEPRIPLASALAAAIAQVRDRHSGTCDLSVRATPAATVTAVRAEPGGLGYLALSDSSIVADFGDARPPHVITDRHRHAAADPDARQRAVSGELPEGTLTDRQGGCGLSRGQQQTIRGRLGQGRGGSCHRRTLRGARAAACGPHTPNPPAATNSGNFAEMKQAAWPSTERLGNVGEKSER